MIPELKALLEAALSDRAAVYTEDVGPDGTRPAVWLTRSGLTYVARPLHGTARQRAVTVSAVCVSSSAIGAGRLAQDVADTVDGALIGGVVTRVVLVTPAVEDTTDPTRYRWSATIELSQVTARSVR